MQDDTIQQSSVQRPESVFGKLQPTSFSLSFLFPTFHADNALFVVSVTFLYSTSVGISSEAKKA